MTADLEHRLENLKGGHYRITSPQTRLYNCVAFAAGESHHFWWPTAFSYWPENVPRSETLQSFVLAFETLRYTPCDDGDLEAGFEKVAIYTDDREIPTHMARQLPPGAWISKCGSLEDIEHETLEALEGSAYGKVARFLKRITI